MEICAVYKCEEPAIVRKIVYRVRDEKKNHIGDKIFEGILCARHDKGNQEWAGPSYEIVKEPIEEA